MTLPAQSSIELPLLLELERHGGRTPAGDPVLYDAVSRHFPNLTSTDRQLKRADGRTPRWENAVQWARNQLRVHRQINGGERGVWQITEAGRRRLREGLRRLGIQVQDIEAFIRSSETLHSKVSDAWKPAPRRFRKRGPPREPSRRPQEQEKPPHPPETVSTTPTTQAPAPAETAMQKMLITRVLSLNPDEFERLVAGIFQRQGFKVQVTGRSHDGGIDGIAEMPLLRLKVALQAKKWSDRQSVGIELVQRLIGSVVQGKCASGVLITTSAFTPGAREAAEQSEVKVSLVDGGTLVKLMLDNRIGVKETPVVREEVDEGFFESLSHPAL